MVSCLRCVGLLNFLCCLLVLLRLLIVYCLFADLALLCWVLLIVLLWVFFAHYTLALWFLGLLVAAMAL